MKAAPAAFWQLPGRQIDAATTARASCGRPAFHRIGPTVAITRRPRCNGVGATRTEGLSDSERTPRVRAPVLV